MERIMLVIFIVSVGLSVDSDLLVIAYCPQACLTVLKSAAKDTAWAFSSSTELPMERCAQCGTHGDGASIRRCSRCKTVRYCSRDCQTRHWPRHKSVCKPEGSTASGLHKEEMASSADPQASGGEAPASGDAESGLMACQKCKTKGKNLKRCVQCQTVAYCSRDCQRGDWKVHSVTCKTAGDVKRNDVGLSLRKAQGHATPTSLTRTEATTSASARGGDTSRWANLFGTLYDTETERETRDTKTGGQAELWRRAKARAEMAFPGIRVVSLFRDMDPTPLDSSALVDSAREVFPSLPADCATLAQSPFVTVMKVINTKILPWPIPILVLEVEDSQESAMEMVIELNVRYHPRFREANIQIGRFLCVSSATIMTMKSAQDSFFMVFDIDSFKLLED